MEIFIRDYHCNAAEDFHVLHILHHEMFGFIFDHYRSFSQWRRSCLTSNFVLRLCMAGKVVRITEREREREREGHACLVASWKDQASFDQTAFH